VYNVSVSSSWMRYVMRLHDCYVTSAGRATHIRLVRTAMGTICSPCSSQLGLLVSFVTASCKKPLWVVDAEQEVGGVHAQKVPRSEIGRYTRQQ
jgi:hypothetical protein